LTATRFSLLLSFREEKPLEPAVIPLAKIIQQPEKPPAPKPEFQTKILKKTQRDTVQQEQVDNTETVTQVTPPTPDPSESLVHGKEVHVAKQKQTQKEASFFCL